MKNSKQPIAPSMWTRYGEGENDYQPLKDGQKTGYEVKFGGLTKREYFAAAAMQGILSNQEFLKNLNAECDLVVTAIIEIADKLLAELAKQEGK